MISTFEFDVFMPNTLFKDCWQEYDVLIPHELRMPKPVPELLKSATYNKVSDQCDAVNDILVPHFSYKVNFAMAASPGKLPTLTRCLKKSHSSLRAKRTTFTF